MEILAIQPRVTHHHFVEAGKRVVVEGAHVGFPLCAFGAWTGTAFILEGVQRTVFVAAV
jgi:hypothetical protein